MKMATIYELTEAYRQLLELAEDQHTDQKILADTMEALDGEIEAKADGYAKVITELNARAKTIKQEEDRLADHRKAIENNANRIKKRLEESMIALDKRKIKTDLFSFNIQKNPPSLIIDNVNEIPEEFLIPQPAKLDNEAVKRVLKNGEKLNWCHLTQTESLRIR